MERTEPATFQHVEEKNPKDTTATKATNTQE